MRVKAEVDIPKQTSRGEPRLAWCACLMCHTMALPHAWAILFRKSIRCVASGVLLNSPRERMMSSDRPGISDRTEPLCRCGICGVNLPLTSSNASYNLNFDGVLNPARPNL